MQVPSGSNQPFLTNDWIGVAKILGVIVLPILAAMWKFMRSDIKQDINGLGQRVQTVENTQLSLDARMDAVEKARLADDEKFRQLFEGMGAVKQALADIREDQTDGKLEIIASINNMQTGLRNEISQTNIGMAEMRGEMRAFRSMYGLITNKDGASGE